MNKASTERANDSVALPSSFRDPSGRVFFENGVLKRGIASVFQKQYEMFISSGLYDELIRDGLLVPHTEDSSSDPRWYKVMRPLCIPFISYPYEWSFSAYQDAALLTLAIHKRALKHGMILKDASAYNVQWLQGRPVFIDLLSFEPYREGEPWVAYKQFCQHFLAPLALMSKTDIHLSRLMALYIDGVPLDLASTLLPKWTWGKVGLLSHLHLHARMQRAYAGSRGKAKAASLSKERQLVIVDHLIKTVTGLKLPAVKTEWRDYYRDTNYSEAGFQMKEQEVRRMASSIAPRMVWDIGGNDGTFAAAAVTDVSQYAVSFDIDPLAVEQGYTTLRRQERKNILPLVLDLTNPSPSLGWAHRERQSLVERGPADLVLALALVHHLAISNNLPLKELADFFAEISSALIIEFVPKTDSQVQRLLASRKDIFDEYDESHFERAFAQRFDIVKRVPIADSKRTLYLMRKA